MSPHAQAQSLLFSRLPPEVRDGIYLELWRSCGLRQHILWHGRLKNSHFCRWRCSTEFQVHDPLQSAAEDLRRCLGVPLGEKIRRRDDPEVVACSRRLQSPWLNHWACGERTIEAYGMKGVHGFTTSGLYCWKAERGAGHEPLGRSPYLPMLLSCKLMSEECLRSIYESTTFIFTDLRTLQMFFGYCKVPPLLLELQNVGVTPPGFFKYARRFELTLSPDFPLLLACVIFDIPGLESRHEAYDFHWLHLERFENLSSVDIWVPARSTTKSIEGEAREAPFTGITELGLDSLADVLGHLTCAGSVTVSTPLAASIALEDGYVDGVPVRTWKRGTGDRFHAVLTMIEPRGTFDGWIDTTSSREVRLSTATVNHVVMRSG